jgi:hypothetical protein
VIDFKRDIKITSEDIEIQDRLKRERRPFSMNEYLDFLRFSQELFGSLQRTPSPKRQVVGKRFEL